MGGPALIHVLRPLAVYEKNIPNAVSVERGQRVNVAWHGFLSKMAIEFCQLGYSYSPYRCLQRSVLRGIDTGICE